MEGQQADSHRRRAVAATGLALGLLLGGAGPALIGSGCVTLGIAAVVPSLYVAAAGRGRTRSPWWPPWACRAFWRPSLIGS
jgi:hypothetical protein